MLDGLKSTVHVLFIYLFFFLCSRMHVKIKVTITLKEGKFWGFRVSGPRSKV